MRITVSIAEPRIGEGTLMSISKTMSDRVSEGHRLGQNLTHLPIVQYSESEGGRLSHNSMAQLVRGHPETQTPVTGPRSEAAHRLSSRVSGRLCLDPPNKRMRLESPLSALRQGMLPPLLHKRMFVPAAITCPV